ncbi:MAG: Hpt domain-containing protein [Microscillaceae bacterium]|nr:Hpt domain-containing protein [Microscillaceae bacterium]
MLKQVIEVFFRDTPVLLKQMEAAFKAKDAEALRSAVHKYKSSSRQLGALGLSQLCLEAEQMAKAKQHTAAGPKLEQIKKTAAQVLAELKAIQAKL